MKRIKPTPFVETLYATQPVFPNLDEFTIYLKQIWKNKYLTNNGPMHEMFKKNLREVLAVENIELFTNGHLSLEIALKTLDITGEVITTPFTFASTTQAIINVGATPVFCDIEEGSYNIDVSKIEALITPKTEAIMAVHVFGCPCDVQKIEAIAKKNNLKVIYDAAHAFGVKVDGKDISLYGDTSMFSFHATKVFHTIEGGALVFKDGELANKMKALKNFGIDDAGDINYVGTNAKMNEIQAAMGLSLLPNIEEIIKRRGIIWDYYYNSFISNKKLKLLNVQGIENYNYAYFTIVFETKEIRDRLFDAASEYNIVLRKYFYPLCNDFNSNNFNSAETPIAKSISDCILSLPLSSDMKLSDAQKVVEILEYELECGE